jgi:hypothetical protein
VLAELVDRVGNVETCESDILQSTDNVTIFGGIGEHFTIKLGHFGTSSAWSAIWFGICHSSTGEEVLYVFGLSEMKSNGVPDGLDAKEVSESSEIFHGKVNLKFNDDILHVGLIVTCDNDIIYIDLEKNVRVVSVIDKKRRINLRTRETNF